MRRAHRRDLDGGGFSRLVGRDGGSRSALGTIAASALARSTLGARPPLGTFRTIRTLRPFRTIRAFRTFRAIGTVGTIESLAPLRALRLAFAFDALRSL